jgi:hypothetical protein
VHGPRSRAQDGLRERARRRESRGATAPGIAERRGRGEHIVRTLRFAICSADSEDRILADYQRRYEAEVEYEIEAIRHGDEGPVSRKCMTPSVVMESADVGKATLVQRTTLLRNLESGIYMTKHLVQQSVATLDRLAELDADAKSEAQKFRGV